MDYSKDRKNDYTAEIEDGYVIRTYYAQTLCKRNHYTNAELCYHPSYMILYICSHHLYPLLILTIDVLYK